jgi:hypothetical protein
MATVALEEDIGVLLLVGPVWGRRWLWQPCGYRIKYKTEVKAVSGSPKEIYLVATEFTTDMLADLVRFFVDLHYL